MNLAPQYISTLQNLFAKHPCIKEALLFGSRALGTHKESSDIDIALKGDISPTLIAHLKEELEDSALPYFCDIISYEKAPKKLKESIDSHALPLYTKEEQWQEVRLGDIATRITSGGTPSTTTKENYDGNIPWLNTKEVKNCRIYKTEKTISDLGLKNSSAKWIEKDSVIVAMYGATAGKVAINKIPLTTNQACCNITINPLKADYRFVYYLLLNQYERFTALASGAAQQNLNVSTISNLTIPLPPLERQREIAEILSSFDDKIDFLHRQNKTLESLAQTLFHHYFIENTKEEWEEKPLSEFGKVVCGKTPSKSNKSFYGGNYPFIKIPDMHGNTFVFSTTDTLTQEGADSQKNKILPPFSICVSCIATVGLVSMNATEAQTNQQINSIIPHKPYYRYYLFLYLQSLYDELHALASGGTATLNLNTTDFSKIKIPMPSDEELLSFNNEIEVIFIKIFENQKKGIALKNTQNLALQRLLDER